jgi:hypothetical protein
MLSYYASVAAHPNMSLSAMLVRLATWIVREIEHASLYSKKSELIECGHGFPPSSDATGVPSSLAMHPEQASRR